MFPAGFVYTYDDFMPGVRAGGNDAIPGQQALATFLQPFQQQSQFLACIAIRFVQYQQDSLLHGTQLLQSLEF